VRRRASSSCFMTGLDGIPAWHRLCQSGSPLRRIEGIGEVQRFVDHLTLRALHDPYRVAGTSSYLMMAPSPRNLRCNDDAQDGEGSIGGVCAGVRRDGVTSREASPDWG
jgi:hypothetical protein